MTSAGSSINQAIGTFQAGGGISRSVISPDVHSRASPKCDNPAVVMAAEPEASA
jgi:hypothetical protein